MPGKRPEEGEWFFGEFDSVYLGRSPVTERWSSSGLR